MGSECYKTPFIEQLNPITKGSYRLSNATSHNFRVKTPRHQVHVVGGVQKQEINQAAVVNKEASAVNAENKDERNINYQGQLVFADEQLSAGTSITVSIPAEGAVITVERVCDDISLKPFSETLDITFDKSGKGTLYYYELNSQQVKKVVLQQGREFAYACGSEAKNRTKVKYPPLAVSRCPICPKKNPNALQCTGHQYNTKTHSFVELQ